ncbi:MAG: hypothetical protein FIB05_17020 [Betaproteobacteria bacterium]|nr:hypothetical protein [Betaproteobacteria bacterium]
MDTKIDPAHPARTAGAANPGRLPANRWPAWAAAALLALAAACGGGGNAESVPAPPVKADIALLFYGNSHTRTNDVPGLVAALVRAVRPGRSVEAVTAPGSQFLDERLSDAASREVLASQRWSAVVFQAQKYSASGQFSYSTAEAAQWVRLARDGGAVPVLFPEWPRLGVDETQSIFELYVSIAAQAPACVAPVPQAWDIALSRQALLPLHAPDGNHSQPAGALLAALVIASTIAGDSPAAMPTLAALAVDAATQADLRAAAAQAVVGQSPRRYCPADTYPG